jgi:hypothetical protein
MQMTEAMEIVIIALSMFGVGWLAVRLMTGFASSEYSKEARELRRIADLSLAEAARIANELLVSSDRIEVQPRLVPRAGYQALPVELSSLLSKYEKVRVLTPTGACLDSNVIGPSSIRPGYFRVGTVGGVAGGTFQGELAVSPSGDETIYELYEHEETDPTFGTYRSVHHWIIAMTREASVE